MSNLSLTPQLVEALAEFCEPDGLMCQINAIDSVEDLILDNTDAETAFEHLSIITSLRWTRSNLKKVHLAVTQDDYKHDEL